MKSLILLLSFLLISTFLISQPWVEQINNDHRDLDVSFYDYQTSFNNYCNEHRVENGYTYANGEKTKVYGWKQFKRWESYWRTRVNKSDGSFPTAMNYKHANDQYQNQKRRMQANTSSSRSLDGDWVNLGPTFSDGGYAGVGRISRAAFHPTDPSTYWVTTPQGGLWKTTDDGDTWVTLTHNLEIQATTAIAIPDDYDTSQTIYLGTGEADGHQKSNGIGLMKSTDGGETWYQTGLAFELELDFSVNKIIIHPDNNQIIYAATSNGMYQSIDGGETWILVFAEQYIIDIEFNPADPTIIYASNKFWGKIYRLANNGTSPTIVYDKYDDNNRAKRIELTVCPTDPEIVYAVVVGKKNGLKEILKSTDSGLSFEAIFVSEKTPEKPNILSHSYSGEGEKGQGYYDLAFTVDPNNSNILYCGGINIWKSVDGGESWEIETFWWNTGDIETVHADQHFLAFNGDKLYNCNDGGMYQREENGEWQNISNGIINTQIYKLGIAQTDPNISIIGTQDNGTKMLDNNGQWDDVSGGDGMESLIDYTDHDIQYATLYYGELIRTKNRWFSSSSITPDNAKDGAWITPFVLDPIDHSTIYGGYVDVWKSTNLGTSWEKISNFDHEDETLTLLSISPSNPDHIFTSDDSYLWETDNGGETWHFAANNLPVNSILTDLKFHATNDDIAWATFGGFSAELVYRTMDGGDTWTDISAGLPDIPINAIVQNINNTTEEELYIGTDFGVYVKIGSTDWRLFNNGMPKIAVTDLEIYYDQSNSTNNVLRVSTYGRGLWQSTIYQVVAPITDFGSDIVTVSKSESIDFQDISSNYPTSWLWTFEGGTPSTSTAQNPTVVYNEIGKYNVELTTYNSAGENKKTKNNYIEVVCTYEQYDMNSVCPGSSYIFHDGHIIDNINSETTYTSQLMTSSGCDSIIQTTLTLYKNYEIVLEEGVCTGSDYTYPDGNVATNLSEATSHLSLLSSQDGCDSVVIVNLSVFEHKQSIESATVCYEKNYQFPDGKYLFLIKSDTNYISYFPNSTGCDSTVITELAVLPSYEKIDTINVCYGSNFTFEDGETKEHITEPLKYTARLKTTMGCDSNFVTYIQVNDELVYSINSMDNTICVDGSDNYQWIDCQNNNLALVGETGLCLTVPASGSYGVIAQNEVGCIDTSACVDIALANTYYLSDRSIHISPNPASDHIIIDYIDISTVPSSLSIYDIHGKIYYTNNKLMKDKIMNIDVTSFPQGLFIVKSQGIFGSIYQKLVITRQ